jgi:hypothetical protein
MRYITRLLTVLLLGLALAVTTASSGYASSSDGPRAGGQKQLEKKKRKRARLCRRGERPHGKRPCRRPPRGIVRPPGRSQQGGRNDLETIPKGGGLGAGSDFDRGANAITWARSFRKQSAYAWRCERFVENAFNVTEVFDSAAHAQKALTLSRTEAPRGAIVYFRPDDWNRRLGHVGISLGNGRMISAFDRVVETNYAGDDVLAKSYAGWTDAPPEWPGRLGLKGAPDAGLEAPPSNQPPGTTPTISLTSPAAGSTLSGIVTLTAQAPTAARVEFDAFYATDPANVNTLGWHKLGDANFGGDGAWSLPYDTHAIPDQGNPDWNTVNILAVVLDGAGQQTATRDVKRVDVKNAAAAAAPAPVTPPATRVITVDNRVTNAGGMREDTTPARLTTQPWIRCGSRGCNINGTERSSGGTYDAAYCQTTGERTTNGNDSNANDDANPERFESTRYYRVRLSNGTEGYVSEVWIRAADRGGLGLPGC